jgi:general secretion pathway protein C
MQWNQLLADAIWPPRLAALAVFTALGASLVMWSVRWPATEPVTHFEAPGESHDALAKLPSAEALQLVLGAGAPGRQATAPQATETRMVLTGVVAQAGGQGSALIAVDGAPQKNFRVGTEVLPGLVLQAVHKRQASLGPSLHGPATQTLDLPAAAATLP